MKLKTIIQAFLMSALFVFSSHLFAANLTNKVSEQVSDSVITSKIKSKITLDRYLSALNIGVKTNKGVVYYDGVVDSDSEAETLYSIAHKTNGVRKINADALVIKNSEHPIKDIFITAEVKAQLVKKRIYNFNSTTHTNENVHVETNNGVVYLTGTVRTRAKAQKAVAVAKSVSGVKRVESHLKIVG